MNMDLSALMSEPVVRVLAFAAIFVVMGLWEFMRPRRQLRVSKPRRWTTNLSIVGLGVAMTRVMGFVAQPLLATGAAALAQSQGWGLLNYAALPRVVEVVLAVVVLDFAIWTQHVLSHRIPVLWRLHRMHHADLDFDVTTALRFHPVEIELSMIYKVGWVLLLGPSVLAVIIFEVVLNACAVFNHANVSLPGWLERPLRQVLVTPDMHRVHHSTLPHEHHTNFGFNLSLWDRLFATYTAQPAAGHADMSIGLPDYRDAGPTRLSWSLALPFRGTPKSRSK